MSPQYDWRRLAELHRPTDPAVIAAEVRSLYRQGLKPRDIAVALRIGVPAVLQVLEGELA
jgi:hypothetical protein